VGTSFVKYLLRSKEKEIHPNSLRNPPPEPKEEGVARPVGEGEGGEGKGILGNDAAVRSTYRGRAVPLSAVP
jgi:hypothetical protein